MKRKWGLGEEFRVSIERNKEIGLIQGEMEEQMWRRAGAFNDIEKEGIKKMFSLKRGEDAFDKPYFEMDLKSLEEFMEEANSYDNRLTLTEQWLERKEREVGSRYNLPPEHLQLSDKQLHEEIESKFEEARRKLVKRIFDGKSSDEINSRNRRA